MMEIPMDPMMAALLGLAAGAAVVWLARRSEIARMGAARDGERARADSASRDLATERAALAAARARLEAVEHGTRRKSIRLSAFAAISGKSSRGSLNRR